MQHYGGLLRRRGTEGTQYINASKSGLRIHNINREGFESLVHAAPTFIFCLNSQSFTFNKKCVTDIVHADGELRIAGAFKDGKQIVVEPLSNSLLYPNSRRDGRVMELAQDLFSLFSCFGCIARGIGRYSISRPGGYVPSF